MSDYRITGRPKTIYRVVKNPNNPYVMIDRRPIDNPDLSFKAKGILTYLMARPDGWEVSVTDLVNHAADGVDSVRSGLNELKKAGHIRQVASRQKGRITGWLIEVYEIPLMDFPDVEKPDVEKPHVENPTQSISNKVSKKKEVKKKMEDGGGGDLSSSSSIISEATQNARDLKSKHKAIAGGWSDAIADFPPAWIAEAVDISITRNVKKWSYVHAILKNWRDNGKAKSKGNQSHAEKTKVIDDVLYSDADRAAAARVKARMDNKKHT